MEATLNAHQYMNWILKMWCVAVSLHAMEYYVVINNEILPFAMMQMDLEYYA